MRILIADRFGVVREEIRPLVDTVSWILNGVGRLYFTLAQSDPKAIPENLAFGNRVWVEFDNGLPPWAGVIMPPRVWDAGANTVEITAYEIGHLLKFRTTDRGRYFTEQPAGAIFAAILRETEAQDPLGIVVRNVWYGGLPHSPAYHFKSAWWILTESLRKMEVCDFRFYPTLKGGRILWYADLQERIGRDLSGAVALVQGANLAGDPRVEEQGSIINEVATVGTGTTWGPDRPIVIARNEESIARYGLLQSAEQFASVSEETTLERHAKRILQENSRPRRRFSIQVADMPPGRFADYDIGDTVRLEVSALWGYVGRVRVLAREYRPQTGTCTLVVEEEPETPLIYIRQDLQEEAE